MVMVLIIIIHFSLQGLTFAAVHCDGIAVAQNWESLSRARHSVRWHQDGGTG